MILALTILVLLGAFMAGGGIVLRALLHGIADDEADASENMGWPQ